MSKESYNIVYRVGGQLSCRWVRVTGSYESPESAKGKAEEIERMGYKTLVMPWSILEVAGLPIGWDRESVDFDRDEIQVSEWESRWTSYDLLRPKEG